MILWCTKDTGKLPFYEACLERPNAQATVTAATLSTGHLKETAKHIVDLYKKIMSSLKKLRRGSQKY